MKILKLSFILIVTFFLSNCGNDTEKNIYPLNKRYWTPEDYKDVTQTLRFGYDPDEKLPSFDDPETRAVVEKYTDPQNYLVILEDKELGIKHKSQMAQDFFNQWRDMLKVYDIRDRQDKYVYEKEMLKVYQFGLGLQQYYFDIGNQEIIERSDNPDDVKNTVKSNIQSLVNNYKNYLDLVNDEKSFSDEGLKLYSEGLVKYYTELINKFPDANFSSTKTKMEKLKKKAQSEEIKKALTQIIELIDEKSKK